MIHTIQHLFHLHLIILSDATLYVNHDFFHESAAYIHFLRTFSAWWYIDTFAGQALKDLGDPVILFGGDQALVPVVLFEVQSEAAHADVTSEP